MDASLEDGVERPLDVTNHAPSIDERHEFQERNRRAYAALSPQPDGATYLQVAADLTAAGAEFVVVGEAASAFVGGEVLRLILEIVCPDARENSERVLQVLRAHRAVVRHGNPATTLTHDLLLRSAKTRLMTDAGAVDLRLDSEEYASRAHSASRVIIDEQEVLVASRPFLTVI